MSLDSIIHAYTFMLSVRAVLLSYLFLRCSYALYRNHLEHKVRLVIAGTAILGAGGGFEAWVRVWGRVEQMVCGIEANQANPGLALLSLFIADVCLAIWVVTIEMTTHLGIVPSSVPKRRKDDPQK